VIGSWSHKHLFWLICNRRKIFVAKVTYRLLQNRLPPSFVTKWNRGVHTCSSLCLLFISQSVTVVPIYLKIYDPDTLDYLCLHVPVVHFQLFDSLQMFSAEIGLVLCEVRNRCR